MQDQKEAVFVSWAAMYLANNICIDLMRYSVCFSRKRMSNDGFSDKKKQYILCEPMVGSLSFLHILRRVYLRYIIYHI